MKRLWGWLLMAGLINLIMFCQVSHIYALERCQQYIPEIRKWNYHYWGLDYPYHFAVGQAQQESCCRANVTSFDGGEGLFQFTGSTKNWTREQMGENLNFYNPSHAIKAGAWYMRKLHKQNWDGALWLDFQAFNGGWTLLKKERARAVLTNWTLMKQQCKRKIIVFKSGNILNFCDVNYDYSKRIYKYGQQYKLFDSGKWRYW